MQRENFKPNVDKAKHGLIEREISHFGSKEAKVTVCVRRSQFWFDPLHFLVFLVQVRRKEEVWFKSLKIKVWITCMDIICVWNSCMEPICMEIPLCLICVGKILLEMCLVGIG